MNDWGVGIMTCPRPIATLIRTLSSLDNAGFGGWSYLIYNDEHKSGHMAAWLALLKNCVSANPKADYYFIIEDDTVFCQGLRTYLEKTLWPDGGQKVALCSPYSIGPYRSEQNGWHREDRGLYLVSSNAWVLHPDAVKAILAYYNGKQLDLKNNVDRQIGEWAQQNEWSTWFHTPSLGQHIGFCNSTLWNNANNLGYAVDFVGEDKEP